MLPGTWAAMSGLLKGKDFDSIHPSLQRQAILNMAYGLYEVLPGKIYQVRGYDLANISFIKGNTGWIVFDPLTAKETAAAALKFINEQARRASGGRRGLLPLPRRPLWRRAWCRGRSRCAKRQGADHCPGRFHGPCRFGECLCRQRHDAGACSTSMAFCCPAVPSVMSTSPLARTRRRETSDSFEPTMIIAKDIEEMTVDGVKMVFQNTPAPRRPPR